MPEHKTGNKRHSQGIQRVERCISLFLTQKENKKYRTNHIFFSFCSLLCFVGKQILVFPVYLRTRTSYENNTRSTLQAYVETCKECAEPVKSFFFFFFLSVKEVMTQTNEIFCSHLTHHGHNNKDFKLMQK